MATRILIVDDNSVLCKGLSALLGQGGSSVRTATDGNEALAMVKEQPFDLIFLDCLMPHMSVLEVTRTIREFQRSNAVVRIIGMRSELFGMNAEQCLAAGMDDSIDKLNDPEVYEAVVNRWFPAA